MEVDFGGSVFSFSPSEHWETPQSDNTSMFSLISNVNRKSIHRMNISLQ